METPVAALQPTLLYVDDEEINLRNFFFTYGDEFHVLTARSGEAALSLLKNTPDIACVVTDQRMPGMSGVEFLVQVRELSPLTVRMVLSAFSDSDTLMQAVNEGAISRYLTKPWDENELRLACRSAIGEYRLRREREQLIQRLERKQEELSCRAAELAMANEALQGLYLRVDNAREEMSREVLGSIGRHILPLLEQCLAELPAGRHSSMLACIDQKLRKLMVSLLRQFSEAEALSPMEQRVAALYRSGFSAREISGLLNISDRTVKNHCFRIREKLGIRGTSTKLREALASHFP